MAGIDSRVWFANIVSAVGRFADHEWQSRVWLGQSRNHVSSWTEDICYFFDDCLIDEFLSQRPPNLSLAQRQFESLKRFRDELEAYAERATEPVDDKKILNDPAWLELCRLANETFNVLRD